MNGDMDMLGKIQDLERRGYRITYGGVGDTGRADGKTIIQNLKVENYGKDIEIWRLTQENEMLKAIQEKRIEVARELEGGATASAKLWEAGCGVHGFPSWTHSEYGCIDCMREKLFEAEQKHTADYNELLTLSAKREEEMGHLKSDVREEIELLKNDVKWANNLLDKVTEYSHGWEKKYDDLEARYNAIEHLYKTYRNTAHSLYGELNGIAGIIKFTRENIAIAHTAEEWSKNLPDGYTYIEESVPFTEEDFNKIEKKLGLGSLSIPEQEHTGLVESVEQYIKDLEHLEEGV